MQTLPIKIFINLLNDMSFFLTFFIGVELIYSVVLVSGVQQSESYIYIHMHIFIHSFSDTFPILVITVYWIEVPVLYSVSHSVVSDSLPPRGL